MELIWKCTNYIVVDTGGCFRGFSLVIMQYNRAKYGNNIQENIMKIRKETQNVYHNVIFGLSGNYFSIQSRGQRCNRMTSPTLYSWPCSAQRHSDTQCQHSDCTRYLSQIRFFWPGFIWCYKTSVKYVSRQPLQLRTHYQIIFRNSICGIGYHEASSWHSMEILSVVVLQFSCC